MKVGIVGCGKIGARHLDAYQHVDGVEVIVSDEDAEKAKLLAEQWGVGTTSPDTIFDAGLDAVDVCVPSARHKDWIVRALQAQLHVFCEKPLCLSYEEGIEIKQAAQEAQRNVIVGYLYRYHPSFRFAKETIEHGIIGDPYFALARLGGRGNHQPWKHDSQMGGGAIFEMMVHMLDLLSWLLGPLSEGQLVYDTMLRPEREIDGQAVSSSAPDCAVTTLQAGHVTAVCQSDLASPSFMNYVEIHGTNGSLMASILDFIPTMVYCNEPRVLFDRGHNFRTFGPTNLFQKELASFVDVVQSGELYPWSLLESLELARFIDSMKGSFNENRA